MKGYNGEVKSIPEKLITQLRKETLESVLPELNQEPLSDINIGWNNGRQEIINKAKELWNIEIK